MGTSAFAMGHRLLDRYEIIATAGQGGMGTVYRAKDLQTGSSVAVKVLSQLGPRKEEVERFVREAKILASLQHPAIVAHVEHGILATGSPFLVMEWLDGEDLARYLAKTRLTLDQSVTVVKRVASALAVAHHRGIIHRDIKPSNLFLRGSQIADVVVLDFGIARHHGHGRSATMTNTGAIIGTPEYMAPEQARGSRQIGSPADVFSLGCVLFECIAGHPPFTGEHLVSVLAKILFDPAPELKQLCPRVSESVSKFVSRVLCKDPSARPVDATAFLADLETLDTGGQTDEQANAASTATLIPALTDAEQRLISVVIAVPPANPSISETASDSNAAERTLIKNRELQESLSAFGARVDWLADGSLIAILMTGGTATDQAVLAARCALLLQERWPEARISLATGRGQIDDQTPVGEAIDRATRLLYKTGRPENALASESGIALDTLSAGLLAQRFTITDRDETKTLIAECASNDETRLLLGKPTPCVGREQELSILESAMAICIEESGARAVLVTGAPGGGKSRLWRELMRRRRDREPEDSSEGVFLIGRGDPMGSSRPFGLLAQSLRRLFGLTSATDRNTHRATLQSRVESRVAGQEAPRITAFLAELCNLSDGGPLYPGMVAVRQDSALMREQIRLALADFLRAEAAQRPIMILLEDLHWGDAASVQLVGELLVELADCPLFILGLARPEIHDRFPNLWGGKAQEIPLRALTRKACERLVQQALGRDIAPTTVARIVEQSAGNALYLEELVRAFADGHGSHIPETVVAMMQARLLQMSPEVRRVLRAASLFGSTFWQGGVLQLLGTCVTAEEVSLALQTLFSGEAIERHRTSRYPTEVQFGFRHALLRDAAYGLLPDEDLRVGHYLAARYLEQAGERDPLVLLSHYKAAGDLANALPHHVKAGDQARRLCSFAQAQEHYSCALATLRDMPDSVEVRRQKIDVLVKLADTQIVADRSADTQALFAEAEAALATLIQESGLAAEDQRRRTWVDYTLGRMHYFRGNPAEAIRSYRRVLPFAAALGRAELVAYPAALVGTAIMCQGFADQAERLLIGALPPLDQLGDIYEFVRAKSMLGWAQAMQGRRQEGLLKLQEGLAQAQGKPLLLSLVHLCLGALYLSTGEWEQATEQARTSLDYFPVVGDLGHRLLGLAGLALSYSEQGQREQSLAHLSLGLTLSRELAGRVLMFDVGVAHLATAAFNLGEYQLAWELAQQVLKIAQAFGTRLSAGIAERLLGEIAATDTAHQSADVDRHFSDSIKAFTDGRLEPMVAHTEVKWALIKRQRGSLDAQVLFDSGISRLARCGCDAARHNAERRWQPDEA